MKTQSCIASRGPPAGSPVRHLPLVDLLVDTKAELLELALRAGVLDHDEEAMHHDSLSPAALRAGWNALAG